MSLGSKPFFCLLLIMKFNLIQIKDGLLLGHAAPADPGQFAEIRVAQG
jgi:hypothetical protein